MTKTIWLHWGPVALMPAAGRPWLVVLAGTVLLILVAAWTFRVRRRRTLRTFLAATAALCLALLPLGPSLLLPREPVEAILLTAGSSEALLEPARESAWSGAPVLALPEAGQWVRERGGIGSVPDVSALRRKVPGLVRLHVVGWGLGPDEWLELDGVAVRLWPAAEPHGLCAVDWTRQLALAQVLSVEGRVCGPMAGSLELQLLDPIGRVTADVELDPALPMSFRLATRPPAAGRFLYTLELRDAAGEPLQRELIDVHVETPPPLRVLWLESAPRYESKFFKNWMADLGQILLLRSRISRDRHRTEAIGMELEDASRLSTKLLQRFDLLVLDTATAEDLTREETHSVQHAVRKQALGLLLLEVSHPSDAPALHSDAARVPGADGQPPGSPLLSGFAVEPQPDGSPSEARPCWRHRKEPDGAPVPVDPIRIAAHPDLLPLVTDEEGNLLVAEMRSGRGRAALSLLRETYRWVLDGQEELHAAYWSFLVHRLARPDSERDRWLLSPGPVRLDDPLELMLITVRPEPRGQVRPPGVPPELDPLPLAQDPDSGTRWHSRFWPRREGWHRVSAGAGRREAWFFAQEASAWPVEQTTRRLAVSHLQAELRRSAAPPPGHAPTEPRPIPRRWFYLTALLCLFAVWVLEL